MHILQFVRGAKKIARLDVALVEQRLEQVIGLPQTGAKTFGELSLADLWRFLEDPEDTQVNLFCRGHAFLLKR